MTETAIIEFIAAHREHLPGDLLFENSITAMMLVNEHRTISVVNKQFCNLFGYAPEEVVGRQTSLLTPTQRHYEEYRKYFEETREGSIQSSELKYKKKNGDLFWVKLTGIVIPSESERYILWSFDDISSEVRARKEINNRYLELDIIFNKVPTGLVYVVDGMIERVNPSFLAMVEREREDVVGVDIQDVLGGDIIDWGMHDKRLVRIYTGDEYLTVEREIAPISANSAIVLFYNVTQHIRDKKRLLNKARTDGMTGLLNRAAFQEKIQHMLDAPSNDEMSFMLLDVDHFKAINDRLGHVAGDETLIELAALLKKELRCCEVLGRMGGEEFAVGFLANKENAVVICNRILELIRGQLFTKERVAITVSMGLTDSTFSRNFGELYKEADRLLYRAKQAGRNCLEVD